MKCWHFSWPWIVNNSLLESKYFINSTRLALWLCSQPKDEYPEPVWSLLWNYVHQLFLCTTLSFGNILCTQLLLRISNLRLTQTDTILQATRQCWVIRESSYVEEIRLDLGRKRIREQCPGGGWGDIMASWCRNWRWTRTLQLACCIWALNRLEVLGHIGHSSYTVIIRGHQLRVEELIVIESSGSTFDAYPKKIANNFRNFSSQSSA